MAENTKVNDVKENVEAGKENLNHGSTGKVENKDIANDAAKKEAEEKAKLEAEAKAKKEAEEKAAAEKELKEKETKEMKKNKVSTKTFTVEKNVIKKDKDGNAVKDKNGKVVMERVTIERKMKVL